MDNYYTLKINTRVSLVVCTIDDYTALPRSGGNISVRLEGMTWKIPVRKPGGYYIFTDLPEGLYNVKVYSDVYMEEATAINIAELDPKNPVIYVTLKPRVYYPFSEGATLIRLSLRDGNGLAVPDAPVTAVMITENCARAKLSGELNGDGENAINVAYVSGRISAGDVYLISEKDNKESEYCSIACLKEDAKCFGLQGRLQHPHKRGALLLPVVRTRTDQRGETVIYFREPCPVNFKIRLQAQINNKLVEKELDIEAGKTLNFTVTNNGE
jgi:hypothetical protein